MSRMGLHVSLLVLFASVLAVGAVGAVGAADSVTLTVEVVDDDGTAVPGATVTASWDDGEAVDTTASNGVTLLDVPAGADVAVAVEADDLVQNNPVDVGTVDDHTDVTTTLYPAATAAVNVTDGGDAVEGAAVTLTKSGDVRSAATGETGSDGTFVAEGLETGAYTLSVGHPGYYEADRRIDLTADDEAETPVELESGSATVDFRVFDGVLDEQVAADVTIERDGVRDSTLSTSQDSQRSLSLDVNTEYTVRIEKDGYRTLARSLEVGEHDLEREFQIERERALTLTAANERVVVGESTVVDVVDEYGEPAADATIFVDGTEAATTDADGSARVTIENGGDNAVTAETDRRSADPVTVVGVDENGSVPTDGNTSTDEDDSLEEVPGFGVALAVVALLGTAVALGRRRA